MEGGHRFPVHTHADDVLPFAGGPLWLRMTIRYTDYQRFQVTTKIIVE
jgi:hypothetical protein